ncbi:hypothetical protein COLO4_04596 [Corchorus olitorius]|uniref:Uncharacterized protein n=1 Tax=Corchorus olitorius TaxID=93759 RepID=A0A1R3KT97_9ROSI|nr:hypothetical protein COLO4_04596 [Corchorus olitorius]
MDLIGSKANPDSDKSFPASRNSDLLFQPFNRLNSETYCSPVPTPKTIETCRNLGKKNLKFETTSSKITRTT